MRRGAAALRNAFLSPGFRRFGPAFAWDYLRFAWGAARNWGDTGPGVLRLLGHDVRFTNRSSVLFLLHEIFVGAAYDFEPGRPDPLIVDCGANLGMSVLFFRLRFPRARIVAVEPHPGAFRLMEENTRALGGPIERVEAAVTEDGAPVHLHAPPGDDASLVSSVDPEWMGDGEGIAVAGVRLSDLLARQEGEVDFVKLDIEGAEYGVLRDCRRTGALARVREIAIEYHRIPSQPDATDFIATVLREAGFGDVRIDPGISGTDGIVRARRSGR